MKGYQTGLGLQLPQGLVRLIHQHRPTFPHGPMAPGAASSIDPAGNRENLSTVVLSRQASRDEGPASRPSLHQQHPHAEPRDQSIPDRKLGWLRWGIDIQLGYQYAPLVDDLTKEPLVFRRVRTPKTGTQDRHRGPTRPKARTMAGGIDPPSTT